MAAVELFKLDCGHYIWTNIEEETIECPVCDAGKSAGDPMEVDLGKGDQTRLNTKDVGRIDKFVDIPLMSTMNKPVEQPEQKRHHEDE